MRIKKKYKYGTAEFEKEYGRLTFARLLESHRKCEELTQKELADILKISPSSLCDLEKGRKIPTPARAASIAEILGLCAVVWVQAALQDQLDEQGLKMKVSVA